jgi:hypothetical protein
MLAAETQECIICNVPKERGITVCGQFICEACEQEIVHTDVNDERYVYFVNCMKQIWFAALS